MSEKIKSIFLKISLIISSVAALVFLFLFKRGQRSVADLKLEADQRVLKQKLEAIQEKASKSETQYSQAHGDYLRIKRVAPHLFKRPGDGKS